MIPQQCDRRLKTRQRGPKASPQRDTEREREREKTKEHTVGKVVALYDFDPSKIDWPFNRQKPLALSTGQVVEIVHDDATLVEANEP